VAETHRQENRVEVTHTINGSNILATLDLPDHRSFLVMRGNLLDQQVDAIVNAANGHLSHGGGVAAAIERAAGPAFTADGDRLVLEHGPVPTGEAVATVAGNLPFKGVVHTVGPRLGDGNEDKLLEKALQAAFRIADDRNWSSIAFPAVSSGIFAVPHKICARAYVASVTGFLRENPETSLRRFLLCLFPGQLESLVCEEIVKAGGRRGS